MFYEQFGECLNFGNHEDSTIGAKIAELFRLNASTSEDEQLSLKEYVDLMKVQKTMEGPQVQYIDKIVDVPVVAQRQVPTIQTAQKTEEVPKVQFIEQVVDVPVDMQRQDPAVQFVKKTAEVPQNRFIDRVVDTPVVQQRQGTNNAGGPENHGESISAVPGRGCQHARGGATKGAHDPEGAENG